MRVWGFREKCHYRILLWCDIGIANIFFNDPWNRGKYRMRETGISRREFLKRAGALAGGVAGYSLLPQIVRGGEFKAAPIAARGFMRPTFTAPVFVEKGHPIPFEKANDSDVQIISMWLEPAGEGERVSLNPDGRVEKVLIPDKPLQPGLYDIHLKVVVSGAEKEECEPHAVKVVDAFRKDFTFAVMSDVHFGDARMQAKHPGFEVEKILRQEIDTMKRNRVEFCLCCGDLCFVPPQTKKEIMQYAEIVAATADFPVFTVPGNHDGYATGAGGRIQYDTFAQWKNFFGPMNFAASYGTLSIIGINTYEKPAAERNLYGGYGDAMDTGTIGAEQLSWLDQTLKSARTANAKGTIIIFGHHNPTNTVKDVNGPFTTVPFSEKGRTELLALFKKYSVDYYFCGHVHGVHEEQYGMTRIITVPTAASVPAEGNPDGFYLLKFADGRITDIETSKIDLTK